MAHLDLEEQEQLDQLKHFWRQYGNAITWVLIAVLSGFAAWNLYQYWQRSQASQAAALFDEVERIALSGDVAKLERALGDMKDKFASTTYTQQAGLLAAKVYADAGKTEAAQAALRSVAEKASDEGYQAVARLRLAGLLLDAQAFDEALQQLSGNFPASFMPLAADRRGDVYQAQGKKNEAVAQYQQAYKALEAGSEYRRLIDVKLAALGASAAAPGERQ